MVLCVCVCVVFVVWDVVGCGVFVVLCCCALSCGAVQCIVVWSDLAELGKLPLVLYLELGCNVLESYRHFASMQVEEYVLQASDVGGVWHLRYVV